MPLTRAQAYTEAGVNIDAGNSLVSRIKSIVSQTHIHGVLSDIGGFGGLFKPDMSGMAEPVLVASTDGVGTKLKLAFAFDKHDTVGIDLVAMSANDILVQGARPLLFLDYFATGKLDVDKTTQVIAGIAEGCKQAGCALLGGETAEMPRSWTARESVSETCSSASLPPASIPTAIRSSARSLTRAALAPMTPCPVPTGQ